MTVLLDTHVLLWWLAGSAALSTTARHIIRDGSNRALVSAVSAWEISIKRALGKLDAPADLEAALAQSHLETLPISIRHALAAGALPAYHADPFDRMLVAQAQLEGATFLTHDERLLAYGRVCQTRVTRNLEREEPTGWSAGRCSGRSSMPGSPGSASIPASRPWQVELACAGYAAAGKVEIRARSVFYCGT